MKYKLKTSRVRKCLLCGWVSKSIGSQRIIDRSLIPAADLSVEQHFREKHPGVLFSGNLEIVILRLEGEP